MGSLLGQMEMRIRSPIRKMFNHVICEIRCVVINDHIKKGANPRTISNFLKVNTNMNGKCIYLV